MRNFRRSLLLCTALLTSVNLCLAAEPADLARAEQEVRESVIAFNRAYELNDLDAYFLFYQDDATLWFNQDFVPLEDYKKDWYQLVGNNGGVEKNIVSELEVKVSPTADAAVAAYRLEVQTRMPDGQVTRDLSQESDTWFKIDGEWRIAHIHYVSQPQP